MKLINKSFGILAVACMAFTACSEDSYNVGEWDGEGSTVNDTIYQKVSFVGSSKTEEIDPNAPTSFTIQLTRSITKGALSVPVEVTTNTDDIFEVPNAIFADGDSIGTLTVSFPKAEIGKTYTLDIAVTDRKFVSSYTSGTFYTYKVTRAKWNSLGMGVMAENFWFEDEFDVEILQKDDDPSQFRIMHPFDAYASMLDGNQSDMVTLRILEAGKSFAGVNIEDEGLVYFTTINTGYVHSSYNAEVKIYHPAGLSSSLCTAANFANSKVLSYQEDGVTPGQIQLAPYYYMDGVGGWNQMAADNQIVITFPGFTPKYEASIEKDFDWEEVFTGDFKSNILGTTTEATLYKGVCVTKTDDCDKRFEEQYGTIYRIASPYAEEYDLTFGVNADGWVTIPNEDFEVQPIGIQAMGQDVYAVINPLKSEFTDKVVKLDITFTNKKGTLEYGSAVETLSNITYNTIGTADWTYTQFFTNEDDSPYLDAGLELQQREDDPTQYRLLHWGNDVTLYFTIDKNNNFLVPEQEVGYTHPTYGTVVVSDLFTYTGKSDYASKQLEDGTYEVLVNYYVSAGSFGNGPEYVKLYPGVMPAASAARKVAARKAATNNLKLINTNLKKANRLVAKKVNKKSTLVKPIIKK